LLGERAWAKAQKNNSPCKPKQGVAMSTEKNSSSFTQKIITGLLILQTLLIGIQAENRIQQGDLPIEVLLWVIDKCVPVLQQLSHQEKEQTK
jgi:hypothetical protein